MFDIFLSLAVICLCISNVLLGIRLNRHIMESKISVSDLKRSNQLQSFLENIR